MKTLRETVASIVTMMLVSCNGGSKKEGENTTVATESQKEVQATPSETTTPAESTNNATNQDFMNNKGIGPVKSVNPPLAATIDQALAEKGKELFKINCTACHKPTKKFIGPAPKGILERRSPEWIMNMILNPEEMIAKDPIAMQLLAEANGAPMANQHLKEEEARAILEYFRTIE